MNRDVLLTPPQVAKRRGCARGTVYRAILQGRLPSVRVLGRLGVWQRDADAWPLATWGGIVRARVPRGRSARQVKGEGGQPR
jgi:excisionase family DNA binding protein